MCSSNCAIEFEYLTSPPPLQSGGTCCGYRQPNGMVDFSRSSIQRLLERGIQVFSQRSEEQNEVTVFCQTRAIKQPHIIWNITGQLTQDHVVGDEWSFTPHTSSDDDPVARLTTWHNAVTGILRFNESATNVSVGCRHKLSNTLKLCGQKNHTSGHGLQLKWMKHRQMKWMKNLKLPAHSIQP